MTDWYAATTPEEQARVSAPGAWPEAPIENEEVCAMLLEVAKGDVLEFAPAPGENDDWEGNPPARFVYAQLQQAKNLWNAGRAQGDGTEGGGDFVFTPRPLDRVIKHIIRPPDPKPHVL